MPPLDTFSHWGGSAGPSLGSTYDGITEGLVSGVVAPRALVRGVPGGVEDEEGVGGAAALLRRRLLRVDIEDAAPEGLGEVSALRRFDQVLQL